MKKHRSYFVCWPSQVDRSSDRTLIRRLGAIDTRADARSIIDLLHGILVQVYGARIRWVVLDCLRREPATLQQQIKAALRLESAHKEILWHQELEFLQEQIAGDGRLNQSIRTKLGLLGNQIIEFFVSMQIRALDSEEALTPEERTVAQQALTEALIQLESLETLQFVIPSALAVTVAADSARESNESPAPNHFVPSSYQQAIFAFINHGQGDALVHACSGSGKTTTLIKAAALIPSQKSAVFIAFNKHVTKELDQRLKETHMVAKTIHSIGLRCLSQYLGQITIAEDKYKNLCREHTEHWVDMPLEERLKAADALKQIVHFARLTLSDLNQLDDRQQLFQRFNIEIDPAYARDIIAIAQTVITAGEHLARSQRVIDFNDMVYLPWRWNLHPPKVDFMFVDEAQDLNAAQLDLILKCRAQGGRMLFVGDPNQAIYGFAGADPESFWRIQERTQATVFPLSICYRCPTSHVALAKHLVPEIEARPDAPQGTIRTIREAQIGQHLQRGDMVLCRFTAPLVQLCMQLIEQQIPATVRGRDLSNGLTQVVQAVARMAGFRYAQFETYLLRYAREQTEKLAQRANSESLLTRLYDRVEAVRTCATASQAQSSEALCTHIKGLFQDADSVIALSTIHRAKGLESDRVFILKPDMLPFVWPNQEEWEFKQEVNLRYVALTRSRSTLYFVQEDERPQRAEPFSLRDIFEEHVAKRYR